MKVLTKPKKVTKKDRNVSVIIEEAALQNITVIIDSAETGGRYAINLGEYLGKNIKHSIKVLEDAKKAAEEKMKEGMDVEVKVVGDTDGDAGLPKGEGVHLE